MGSGRRADVGQVKNYPPQNKARYSNSLLGGVPLSPTRFCNQEFQVAMQSRFGVGLNCPIPCANSTPKSRAPTADKRVDIYGNNI